MLRNRGGKGLRDEMEESCSPHFLQQPAEDHFDRQRRLRKLPSVRENWALVYSFLFLACTTSAVFCIVTASWFPQSEAGVGSVDDVPNLDLDTGPGGNESFTGLIGPQLDRTAFHFQPPMNWMNDPCAPMYFKGYYHLFYQYNPWGAVWGNMSWGHAVSKDLLHWKHLEPALLFDQWYDIGGVWSGSASIRPSDGLPILLYTGVAEDLTQTQNMAYPADPNDPELREWVKHEQNPLLHPPTVWSHGLQESRTVGNTDFRDPSTAWVRKDENGTDVWRMTVGAQYGPTTDKHGMALVYKTTDKNMIKWELEETWLNSVGGTGIWECVDFFPLDVKGKTGLDTSASGPGVKHVIKVSSWDEQTDYYAVGTYDDVIHPERHSNGSLLNPHSFTVQAGKKVIYDLQYDHGKFYAAKSFYDPVKSRRINWGWSSESHTIAQSVAKGWASVQAAPRVMLLDSQLGDAKYGYRLIQTPIEELKQLRREHAWKSDVELKAGSVQKMKGSSGGQLDIEVTFDKPDVSGVIPTDDDMHPFNCSKSGGSAHQGRFGPFGLLVMADNDRREQTAVFFYLSYSSKEEEWTTHFCSDQSRSSKSESVELTVFQGDVIVLPHEDYISLRVLVDHSIIESFAQGGRTAITARVYPTVAVNEQAQVFLFNNGTSDITVRKIDVWQMESTNAKPLLKASALLETLDDDQPLILPEIHEGIPQVDEPFLASQLASHHPASRPNTQVPARTSSSSLVSPAVCSLLRLPATSSPSDPNQRPSAVPCSQTVVPSV